MAARTALTSPYLSICPGGGGLDAGLELAFPGASAVCYVEIDIPAAAKLAEAIEQTWLPDAPIWSDLFTFRGREWRGLVDGIVGGIPCQPHSFAGKRAGADDARDLWPVTARLVWDVAPAWTFFENVPGILPYYHRVIRPDLEALGYAVTEGIFSAEEVGASHLRERLFWLAYTLDGTGGTEHQQQHGQRADIAGGSGQPMADAKRAGLRVMAAAGRQRAPGTSGCASEGMGDPDGERRREAQCWQSDGRRSFPPGPTDADGWQRWLNDWPGTEPAVRSDADGLARRADDLRVYGNGVVPLAAAHAFLTLAARLGPPMITLERSAPACEAGR